MPIMDNHSLVTERRLKEAMEKLEKHHPQIASRLRTIWRREDDAWARGDPLPPVEPDYDDVVDPDYPRPTLRDRFRLWWKGC